MPETDPLEEYHVLANRLREVTYQDYATEYQRRITTLLQGGIGREEAAARVRAELEGYQRQLAAEMADALLSAEAELRGHEV